MKQHLKRQAFQRSFRAVKLDKKAAFDALKPSESFTFS
jgi:hypothetical protein